jgi:hypothetical protein
MFRSIGAVLLGYVTSMILIMVFSIAFAIFLEGKVPTGNASSNVATVSSNVASVTSSASSTGDPRAPTTTICIVYVVVGFFVMTASGYVTAWVARRHELAHGIVLALFTAMLGAFYVKMRLEAAETPEPLWYLITNAFVLPAIASPLGAALRRRSAAKREGL